MGLLLFLLLYRVGQYHFSPSMPAVALPHQFFHSMSVCRIRCTFLQIWFGWMIHVLTLFCVFLKSYFLCLTISDFCSDNLYPNAHPLCSQKETCEHVTGNRERQIHVLFHSIIWTAQMRRVSSWGEALSEKNLEAFLLPQEGLWNLPKQSSPKCIPSSDL